MKTNADPKVVQDFGREWQRFDQAALSESELRAQFQKYFHIFPWEILPPDAVGFDLGSGSGRWAKFVAPMVGQLTCIDASAAALAVARRTLSAATNCRFLEASVDDVPLDDESMDFGYSLGVLHHIPDTTAGLRSCVAKLKRGAPFLVYLYYSFDNQPGWYRVVWRCSDVVRRLVSRLPHRLKVVVCDLIATVVYWPAARLAALLECAGFSARSIPLAHYRHMSFYSMRTDALDRFGTRLERRFSRQQILEMMRSSGLENIRFSESDPFWCAVGVKA